MDHITFSLVVCRTLVYPGNISVIYIFVDLKVSSVLLDCPDHICIVYVNEREICFKSLFMQSSPIFLAILYLISSIYDFQVKSFSNVTPRNRMLYSPLISELFIRRIGSFRGMLGR